MYGPPQGSPALSQPYGSPGRPGIPQPPPRQQPFRPQTPGPGPPQPYRGPQHYPPSASPSSLQYRGPAPMGPLFNAQGPPRVPPPHANYQQRPPGQIPPPGRFHHQASLPTIHRQRQQPHHQMPASRPPSYHSSRYETFEHNAPHEIAKMGRNAFESRFRYTAVSMSPAEYGRDSSIQLRQHGHHTEILVVLTMYNEDDEAFHRTFDAVIRNIEFLAKRDKSKTWGKHAWEKVVVCVISDGRAKCDERTKALMTLYGGYSENEAAAHAARGHVEAHVFEYTTRARIDMHGNCIPGSHMPIQLLVCMKETNKKKLNSHRWAFDAFAEKLQPKVCVLFDVGTQPANDAIYHLWKEFDKYPNVGGCCGEMTVDLGHLWHLCLNPLVAAQRFEYKMAAILDKPLESVFGFISVLPGAFSAYRWDALRGEPLKAYFLGETMHGGASKHTKDEEAGSDGHEKAVSLSTTNMYLAEDRILCFEIVTKLASHREPNPRWILKYVKSAKASTDAPGEIAEFVSQRRRWNNGSFFASLYATLHFHRIWTSHHNLLRKLAFSFEFVYNAFVLFFGYIGLSSFYLAFYFICTSATANASTDPFFGAGSVVVGVVSNVYVGVLGVTIICALGNKPSSSKWYYYLCCISFALLFALALYCTVWSIYLSVPHSSAAWKDFLGLLDDAGMRNIFIAMLSTYGLYLVSSLLFLDPWHLITCFVAYMFMSPAYICILSIYAFANLHDLAWGTKGSDTNSSSSSAGPETKPMSEGLRGGVEAEWKASRHLLATQRMKDHHHRSVEQRTQDHYTNLRTFSLMTYLGVNLAIVIWFTSAIWSTIISGGSGVKSSTNYYVIAIFYSVAVMAAIRFLGALLYIITFYAGF